MSEREIYAALGFHPSGFGSDDDHDENTLALDRAVHALIELEMDSCSEGAGYAGNPGSERMGAGQPAAVFLPIPDSHSQH